MLSTSTAGTPSRHVDPTRRAQAVAAWVLALPFVVLFLAFTAGPVLASLGMSFTDFRRADIRSPFAVEFVGLGNYADLVQDPVFRKVTVNTLLYLLLGVPLTMAVALAAAVGINRLNRFKGLFRVGFYLPVVTSIVAVSVVWKFLYRHHGGLFNTMLGWVGIGEVNWLDNTRLALPSLVLMAVWRNFGTLMVIFLAGLQTIPREVSEAAEVDGAGGWAHFRHITLPMLRPTLLFGAVITGIGYLQFFEEAFVMTRAARSTAPARSPTSPTTSSGSATSGTPPRPATCSSSPSCCSPTCSSAGSASATSHAGRRPRRPAGQGGDGMTDVLPAGGPLDRPGRTTDAASRPPAPRAGGLGADARRGCTPCSPSGWSSWSCRSSGCCSRRSSRSPRSARSRRPGGRRP